jgi:MFS family permease
MKTPVEKSLIACIKEGVVAQIMIGIFDYYLVPFALFLGASTTQIGFLISIPNLLASLSQFFAVKAVEMAGDRKTLLTRGIALQAIAILPICFLAFKLFDHRGAQIIVLISLITIFKVMANIIGPAWGSMVSDYLPENRRGRYFGRRSQIVSVAGIIGLAGWGIFLYLMKPVSEAWGFFVVFFAATIFRFVSYYYTSKMVDLHMTTNPEDHFTFWMFIRRFKESNFVKFIFYVASITFATQLSAAYFSVYMIRDLHFNYFTYMTIQLSSALIGLITFPIWGKHADMVGNARVLKLTSFIIPLIPLLWVFATHPFQLVVIEAVSGFVWGGFTLCSTNFIYDAVSPPKRIRCLGYFNLVNGVAIFLGASLGGILAERLPSLGGRPPLVTLFLISAVLRFLADLFLSRHFQEVRASIEKTNSTDLFFSVLGVRPLTGMNLEFEIFPLLKRLSFGRVKSK